MRRGPERACAPAPSCESGPPRTRAPPHRANLRGWGRTTRWEHWCVTTPPRLVVLTVSDLDHLALTSLCLREYGPGGRECERAALVPLARGVRLPERVAGGPGGGDVVVGARAARGRSGSAAGESWAALDQGRGRSPRTVARRWALGRAEHVRMRW
ncbi:DUF2804 family protein [Streptomyces sp. CA-253872]|uniref:DUF2804 family protein n=1 Tax=Streptomyces sp. CA-253872 TaxID=3240067 RepID=UPI003D8EB455